MPAIDPQKYYDAATACHQLATDLETSYYALRNSLINGCGGMAGHYDAVQQWATAYDQHARDLINYADEYMKALHNFGDVLNAAGYNWATADWRANTNPNKGPAPTPRPAYQPQITVQQTTPASASNGTGLNTNIPGLLNQVGIQIPDGDTGKLQTASNAWKAFAADATVTGAASRVSAASQLLDGVHAEDVGVIQDHLGTLRQGAGALPDVAGDIAGPVGDHHQALSDLRGGVDNALSEVKTELMLAVGVTAIAMTVELVATAGVAALGPDEATAAVGTASGAAAVTRTAKILHDLIEASRLLALLGATATGCLAFRAVADITNLKAKIIGIGALTIQLIEDTGQTSVAAYDELPAAPNAAAPDGLNKETEEYIKNRHFRRGGGVDSTKSLWSDETTEEELEALADAAEDTPAKGPNKNGNFERVVDADRIIGSRSPQAGGGATSKYIVITDRWGTIINMYPY